VNKSRSDLICLLESQFGQVDYLSEVQDLACQIVVDTVQSFLNKMTFTEALIAANYVLDEDFDEGCYVKTDEDDLTHVYQIEGEWSEDE
jgi:hypothetical protein